MSKTHRGGETVAQNVSFGILLIGKGHAVWGAGLCVWSWVFVKAIELDLSPTYSLKMHSLLPHSLPVDLTYVLDLTWLWLIVLEQVNRERSLFQSSCLHHVSCVPQSLLYTWVVMEDEGQVLHWASPGGLCSGNWGTSTPVGRNSRSVANQSLALRLRLIFQDPILAQKD